MLSTKNNHSRLKQNELLLGSLVHQLKLASQSALKPFVLS